jgi:hypothetical protein
MDNLNRLKNAIHIRNEYNRIAAPILEHVMNVSKQFIGKKIDTLKGLTAKYSEAIKIDRDSIDVKPLPGTKWAKAHFISVQNSYNDLRIEISLCFSDGSNGCTYESRSFYFGKTENQILVSINEDCKVSNEVLNFETELLKIKTLRKLEKQVEQVQDQILIGREAYQYLRFEKD